MVLDGGRRPRARDRLPDCNRRRVNVAFGRNRNIILHPKPSDLANGISNAVAPVDCAAPLLGLDS